MDIIKIKKKKLSATNYVEAAHIFDNPKAEKLGKLVLEIIAAEPFEFEGLKWAGGRTQPEWAEAIGVSERTLFTLINQPPFVADCTHSNGHKVTLLRLGKLGGKTDRHIANIMSNIFRKRGFTHNQHAYGCLKGLAQVWPEGEQIAIFETVLDNWAMFMSWAKLKAEINAELKGEPVKHRHYKKPAISFILKMHHVAVELYLARLQAKGKPVPASVKAKFPKVYPKPEAA